MQSNSRVCTTVVSKEIYNHLSDNFRKFLTTTNLWSNSGITYTLFCLPPPLTDIHRVTSMKILGATVKNHLSVSEHVRDVTCRCMQSMHALRIGLLQCQDLSAESLQNDIQGCRRCQVNIHLTCRWGFTTADDRCRMDGLLRRCTKDQRCRSLSKTLMIYF